MNFRSDLHAGRAGQHLAAFDLLLKGFDCCQASEGLPYDLIADINGQLLRTQVKSTRKPADSGRRHQAAPGYKYHVRKCGKGGRKRYETDDVDLIALVALDAKEVGYIAAAQMPLTFFARPTALKGTYTDEIVAARNKVIYDRLMSGESPAELGWEFGLDRSYVGRLKFGRARTFVSGFYLSDLTLDKALTAIAANDNRSLGSSKQSFFKPLTRSAV